MKVLFRLIVFLLLCSCVTGCQQKDWQLYDVSGHLPDLRFALTDDSGHAVMAANYRGRTVLLYFGFTGCSSQCPLVMKRLATVLQRIEPGRDSIHVLFVSIDPAHDTPASLRRYAVTFDAAHITGLTGDPAAITALAKRYRIAIGDVRDDMTHSNAVFIFDGQGRARLLLTPDEPDEALIHDLRRLLP